jgi:hypothetical protein
MEIGIDAAPTVLKQNVTLFSRFIPMVKLLYQDHVTCCAPKNGKKVEALLIESNDCTEQMHQWVEE